MARAGLTGESRPRNDDVVPMRLARTMVIDRIQLAVYCLSNCFAGKSLTCFAPRSYRYRCINIHNNNTYNFLRIRSYNTIFRYVVELVLKYTAGPFRGVGVVLPRFAQKIKLSLDTESRKMRLLFLSILAEVQVHLVL